MFRRTTASLPPDPTYPANLTELGFKVNDKGQFVRLDAPQNTSQERSHPIHQHSQQDSQHDSQHSDGHDEAIYFDFFHTSSDRANNVRREAMHTCARAAMLDRLAELGVKPVYISTAPDASAQGRAEVVVGETKPQGKHVVLLSSDLSELRTKREVVVVVGEQAQDLGVWAWRGMMRDGGLREGSAVGLVEKMAGCFGPRSASNEPPGLIILNPGQLLYSPNLHTPLSLPTWLARHKPSALADPLAIHSVHNHLPGHRTPAEHIATCLEAVIPLITSPSSHFYIVGVSEGAETLLHWLDGALGASEGAPGPGVGLAQRVGAVALLQPTHSHEQLRSPALVTFLAESGRSWVISEQPKGTLLKVPEAQKPVVEFAAGTSTSCQDSKESGEESTKDKAGTSSKPKQENAVPAQIPLQNPAISPPAATTSKSAEPKPQLSSASPPHQSKTHPDEELPDYYAAEQVSSPTFSSGVRDYAELVFPSVMDDVLDWFRRVREGGRLAGGAGARAAEEDQDE